MRPRRPHQPPITASALAPLLYRGSPVDPILHSASAQADFEKYNTTNPSILVDTRATSPYPAPGTFARDISRPSSTSTQSSNFTLLRQHDYNNLREEHKLPNGAPYTQSLHSHHNHNLSLPGLSTLASLASASPSQLRYVYEHLVFGLLDMRVTNTYIGRVTGGGMLICVTCNRSFSNNASHSMNYATSSPAPTPGLSGNTPVSHGCESRSASAKSPPYRTLPPTLSIFIHSRLLTQPSQTWPHLLLTMVCLIHSLSAKIVKRRQHLYGEETRLGRCFVMPAACF